MASSVRFIHHSSFLQSNDPNDNSGKFTTPHPKIDSEKQKSNWIADGEVTEITNDEDLQSHWKALESRVVKRKVRRRGEAPSGRSEIRKSAWDHEEV
jgi:hypothetical protein